jgi:hypothetical protein
MLLTAGKGGVTAMYWSAVEVVEVPPGPVTVM